MLQSAPFLWYQYTEIYHLLSCWYVLQCLCMENTEKKFANGLFFSRNANAPDFVVGSLGIQVENAVAWIQQQKQKENGFINVDIKKSREGKYYLELNDFEPRQG